MNKAIADQFIAAYMKPVYGFALKRCASVQDAEDLTQEICLKTYRALIMRDDITSVSQFIWTIAHNSLSNYYRGKQRSGFGICVEDLAETLPSSDDVFQGLIEEETAERLHHEIANLSKRQRAIIIAYYYENQKQEDIATALGIPVGTVKWHLFEAKKELKKGMESMRAPSELKFNPIEFTLCGFNGSIGTKGCEFFRSILPQNIAYLVWKEPKTSAEIGKALGVSPYLH